MLATGTVLLSEPHCVEETEKDDLDMTFIVAFESEAGLIIVTAWRRKS